jgi:DNA-binding response OmpR family regulator
MKILLIEDDKVAAATLVSALKDHYIFEIAGSGKEGEYKAYINQYSLIIVDYVLPDIDGIQVCKNLRTEGITTPIIMLTGTADTHNKVHALFSGVDDYVVKPVDEEELHARIQAILRRSSSNLHSNVIAVDNLTIDIDKKTAKRSNKVLKLKRKDFDLLEYLMRNAGRVVTRSMIFDHIWESNYESDNNVVDVHIKYLRDQVDRNFNKKLIKTVHGYGYKIEA